MICHLVKRHHFPHKRELHVWRLLTRVATVNTFIQEECVGTTMSLYPTTKGCGILEVEFLCGMGFTLMISDGDSRSYKRLCDLQPYDPDITINKKECVNHVAKRMDMTLNKLVPEDK